MGELDDVATPDDVLKVAAQRTGLSDIDSDSWRTGLAIVLDEANNSPAFNPFGRTQIIGECVNALGRRFKFTITSSHIPECSTAPSNGRWSCWACHEPARPSSVTCWTRIPCAGRYCTGNACSQCPRQHRKRYVPMRDVWPCSNSDNELLRAIKPARVAIPHWEDADGPTEDMFIQNQDFKGLSWDAFLPTSRYAEWLINEADMTSAYEYQKRYLQVLQSKAPGTWNLKMPSHSVHIETLLKVFPDARLIWAHRDPYKPQVRCATCSKCPRVWCTIPEAVDLEAMGRNAMTQMKSHVERPLRTRDRIGDDRFFHMYYHEMMNEPMDVMRRIYEWAGDELTDETAARMQTWLTEHPQDRFAPNTYSLDQYGLSVEKLKPTFAEYLSTFDIELEGNP